MNISPDSILLPVTPNRPLEDVEQKEYFGEVLFRTHSIYDLTENILYDSQHVKYDKSYQNNQSLSAAFLKHLDVVSAIIMRHSKCHSTVIEVGCGKGDFLNQLENKGYTSLIGFDATYEGNKPNIQPRYLDNSDKIDAEFIVARHMLDYIAAPQQYLSFLNKINKNKNAKIYIEVPCFNYIKDNNSFFDITYERINYFTLKTLIALFDGNLLESGTLFNDQYIYIVAELSKLSQLLLLEYEKPDHWNIETFVHLFPQLLGSIISYKEIINNSSDNDIKKRIFIWGASTKGCLFLYHYKRVTGSIENFPFLIDINPEKIGKFAPGTKVPICSPSEFFSIATENDVVIIPNANYEQEIRQQLIQAGLKDILLLSF